MKTLVQVLIMAIFLVIGVAMTLIITHIVLSISNLYNITFITQFSEAQIFGAIVVYSIIDYKYRKTEEQTYTEIVTDGIVGVLSRLFIYLLAWGLAFLSYNVLFS
jgi:hypothetical protein